MSIGPFGLLHRREVEGEEGLPARLLRSLQSGDGSDGPRASGDGAK